MGLRPVARWHADANPAKRHICLSIVSVVYSSHSALKLRLDLGPLTEWVRVHS